MTRSLGPYLTGPNAAVETRDRVRQAQAPFPTIEVSQLVLDWGEADV